MKKRIALLLSITFILGFAVFMKQETPMNVSAAVKSAATQKIVIWAWDQNLPSINYAIQKYKKDNPNVNLNADVVSVPDTVSKISTFLASGIGTDLPDIVLMDNLQVQSFLQQFPDKFVNLSKMGFDQYKSSFSKAQWELLSNKGSIYAFPFDIAPVMMEVNTAIMAKAGVDVKKLKTWDDLIAAAPAVKKAGFTMLPKQSVDDVLAMMQSAGVGIFDKDKNIDLLNPTVIAVVEKYMQLAKTGTSDVKVESSDAFAQGKVAVWLKPAWMIGEDMGVQKNIAGKVTLIPMPKIKAAAGYNSSANSGGSSFFIMSTSKVKPIAYEIGKLITTNMQSQNIALAQGLMPGNLNAAKLSSLNAGIKYYNGQKIWKMLSDSSRSTVPIYVNQYYSTAKDTFTNMVIDLVSNGTNKTAKELLQDAANQISSQTQLKIKKY